MLLQEPEPTTMDLRFRLFGTHVRVHPLFWLITAILGFNSTNKPILPGNGLGDLVLWVFCVFFSILLHEFGHVWMGRLFGSEGHIVLQGMGGLAIGSNNQSCAMEAHSRLVRGAGHSAGILRRPVWGSPSWDPCHR